MEYKDYYKTLGVAKDASADEIKKAYRKLARKYHPDVNTEKDAEDNFKDVNEAYEVLGDAEKRSKYDRLGSSWNSHQSGGMDQFDWSQWMSGGIDLEDLLGGTRRTKSSDDFSDFFESIFGDTGAAGTHTRTRVRSKTQEYGTRRDYTQDVEITLEEAYHGTTRVLQTSNNRRLEVKIPVGSKTGTKVRIKGEGINGGDLYLRVSVLNHPMYEVDEEDLKITLPIDLYTALLGGEMEVSTLKGSLKLKIPPETQNGKIFRLRNQGMPKLNDPQNSGNLYVTVSIKLPTNLTHQEKDLFVQLRDMQY
ncbi:MAG: hypothetical protein B6242_15310 [Anaerolineaceae bacterium 4572_78]|nr:MAG: hypothetical protein B6242_15310 [Anaerolineaceae bacterium 4572_78]